MAASNQDNSQHFMEELKMLVLSRKVGERLVIGGNISVIVNKVAGNRVTLGVEAPDDVRIIRGELEVIIDDFSSEKSEVANPLGAPLEGINFDTTGQRTPR